jgi:5-methyltetrahydropteroyltriglutamate--homocysteine methyltransferase
MQQTIDRILTTHAGSLPRPAALTELFARRASGAEVDEVDLERLGAEAVESVVPQQIAAGIDVGNDGEQGRESFFLYVQRRMTGFSGRGYRQPFSDVEAYPGFKELQAKRSGGRTAVSHMEPPKVTDAIRYLDTGLVEADCRRLQRVVDNQPTGFTQAFLTAPSPGIIASAVPNEHYDSFERYVDALTDALKFEYEAIAAAGLLLQVDCPDLALERHTSFGHRTLTEFVEFVELIVNSLNRALENVPRDQVRLHVCWGNYEGPHDRDVALADIWKAISIAEVGAFMFPFANPRHAHEWKHFRTHPLQDDQILVAGVIDTTTNFVEHREVVADRLERAAQATGDPTRIMASTDCGFDTSAGMGSVAPDVVWAKLRAMREGADLASERLL